MRKIFSIVPACAFLLLATVSCSSDPEVAKREYVANGDKYVEKQQYREAVVEYRNAVQQDPKFGEARKKLANTYLKLDDAGNAYKEAVRAADLLPNDPQAQLDAGQLLFVARQFDDAKARADNVLAKDPSHVNGLLLRANALAGQKKIDEAIADIHRAIEVDPKSALAYATLGNVESLRGNREAAEAAYRKAIATDRGMIDARLALVNFYVASGRQEEAQKELTEALSSNPKHLLGNRMLAELYLRTGRAAEAERPFKTLADVKPTAENKFALADYYTGMSRFPEARAVLTSIAEGGTSDAAAAKVRLAALDAEAGNAKQASALVDQVLAANPTNGSALLVKAKLLSDAGRLDEAVAALRTATQAEPRSGQIKMALGRLLLAKREPDAALAAFAGAVADDPRLVAAEVEAGKLHLTAGRLSEAEQFAMSATKKAPGFADAQLLLARVHLLRGRSDAAQSVLRQLGDDKTKSAALQSELGLLELTRKNPAKAREAFERALAIDPAYTNALSTLVRMDIGENKPELAKSRVAAALEKNPKDARLAVLAGSTYASTRDFDSAERVLKRAISDNPDNYEAYIVLARVYHAMNRINEATTEFQAVAARQPRDVGIHTAVALLLDLQNRKEEARAKYEQVLAIDPRAPVAANNLAWMHAEQGTQLDVALHLAQTAKAGLPDQPEVDDTLGWIYVKKGLNTLAVAPLEKAVERDGKNPQYRYHLGAAYAGAGNHAKARQMLESALKLSSTFVGAADAQKLLADVAKRT